MYGKLFSSMYDGTLAEDWRALVTFQQMIILCDADGIIDMTPEAITRRTGIPIEHIKTGIDILQNPDPHSRTNEDDGRRIMLIDEHKPWGWYIVNHKKYKHLQDSDMIRIQTRERVRKHRESKRKETDGNANVTDGNVQKRHTDTNTDTKEKEICVDIFDYWRTTLKHPRAVLDNKRRAKLKQALKTYSSDDLKKAIRGCSLSPYHMGDNDRSTKYDSITLILRDAEHIERFMTYVDSPPKAKEKTFSPRTETRPRKPLT